MYAKHADKLIGLLRGSDETTEQAFILLDSLVDTLPEDGRNAFAKVFHGLSFEKGTFAWMEHKLEKINRWQHDQFHRKGYFWRFVDLYFRAYPENIESLPTVLHLKYITEIPWFLKQSNPCHVIVLDNTSQSVKGLERCTTVSTVRFNMDEWQWRNLSIAFDLDEIRMRTEEFTIIAPGFMARWEMSEGVCELVILKETTERGTHLQPYANQLSLEEYPLLEFSNVWSFNLGADLWKHKTSYSTLEFGALKLELSDDIGSCISDRVEKMMINRSRRFSGLFQQDFSCMMEGVFGERPFPKLQEILIENEGTLLLNLTQRVLQNLPVLQRLSVTGGESNVAWSDEVWGLEHPLKTLTADEFDAFHHHWEFLEAPGTLRERLCKMSVAFDWVANHTDLLQGLTHLNIFQSDVNWPFVSQLAKIEQLYVEGCRWEGDFDYHGVEMSVEQFFEPAGNTKRNTSKGPASLFDLMSTTDKDIRGVKTPLLEKLREMNEAQDTPKYFQTWLEDMGVVRIGSAYAWMDGEVFNYKAYSSIGEVYRQQFANGFVCTLNLERLLLGVGASMIGVQFELPQCRSLRYNNNSIPLSSFKDLDVKELWIEVECDLRGLELLQHLEILHITEQSTWMSDIPEEIGQLSRLRELYLWNNEVLDTLPASMSRLQNLQTINISGNSFTSVPEVLLSLPNLRTVCLRGCSFFDDFDSLQERLDEGLITIDFVDAG